MLVLKNTSVNRKASLAFILITFFFLILNGCTSGLKPGIYYADDGAYSKMEIKGNRIILTTIFIPIEQSFKYKVEGNDLYLLMGVYDMVFKIVNEDIIDGGIYGTFYHESYIQKIKNNPNIYKVVTDKLNVREGPGTDYKVIHQLTKDTYVFIIENMGEWSKIKFDGEKTGYVSSSYLSSDK